MGSRTEELLDLLTEKPDDKPASVGQIVSDSFSPRSAFIRQDTHPAVLDVLLLNKFGVEWLEWDAETIWSEINSEFGVTPSVHTTNKVNALKTMHVVDTPWLAWEVWNVVAQAVVNNIPDFKTLQKPSVSDVICAVGVMAKIKKKEFSEEVGRYIAACFLDDGVWYLPEPVAFAQRYASVPRYRCVKCNNIDTDDDNGMCDSCGAPDRYLEKTVSRDPKPIQERYDAVMAAGDDRQFWLTENVEDVQVSKLVAAHLKSKRFDARLVEQLKAIR